MFTETLQKFGLWAFFIPWMLFGCSPAADDTAQKPTPTESKEIKVSEPTPNAEIGLPLKVKGEARTFEGNVELVLRDSDGKVLVNDITVAFGGEPNEFRPFEFTVSYRQPKGNEGVLELFDKSGDGTYERSYMKIPVRFKKVDSVIVKAFFNNNKKDPKQLNCEKVYPVQRRVPQTKAIARAALEELIRGETRNEWEQGFFTNINAGVKIQDLTIEKGVAKVDFSKELEEGVAGSCKVMAIRAQITETLKQFGTVKEVIISIGGRTKDILQP